MVSKPHAIEGLSGPALLAQRLLSGSRRTHRFAFTQMQNAAKVVHALRAETPLRRAPDLSVVPRPSVAIECLLRGNTFLHFSSPEPLLGMVLWGRPNAADARKLVASLVSVLHQNAQPHVFLLDARRVDSIDPGAFTAFNTYVQEYFEPLQRSVQRLAMVRPDGMPGAAISGFFDVLPRRPYPVAALTDVSDAFRWLGEVIPTLLEHTQKWVAALDGAFGSDLSGAPTLSALHGLLDTERTHSIEQVAKALGLSPRTLQRRLTDAGTSFRQELQIARLRWAQKLLVDTDLPIKHIALDAGCSSVQHFGVLFRRLTGETPMAWREQQRAISTL